MRRKKDDHHASHSNVVNQLLHIVSSSAFLVCYGLVFWDLTTAMWAGPRRAVPPTDRPRRARAAVSRQGGGAPRLQHAQQDPDPRRVPPDPGRVPGAGELAGRPRRCGRCATPVAQALFVWTALVVAGRVAYLVGAKGVRLALVWFVKLITDPVTDILAYSPRYLGGAEGGARLARAERRVALSRPKRALAPYGAWRACVTTRRRAAARCVGARRLGLGAAMGAADRSAALTRDPRGRGLERAADRARGHSRSAGKARAGAGRSTTSGSRTAPGAGGSGKSLHLRSDGDNSSVSKQVGKDRRQAVPDSRVAMAGRHAADGRRLAEGRHRRSGRSTLRRLPAISHVGPVAHHRVRLGQHGARRQHPPEREHEHGHLRRRPLRPC